MEVIDYTVYCQTKTTSVGHPSCTLKFQGRFFKLDSVDFELSCDCLAILGGRI